MTSLLLIISFLLHVVVLIAIFQLYKQNQQLKQVRDDTLNRKMQQFIDEIKQENNYLQQQLSQKNSPPTPFNLHENIDEASERSNSNSNNPIEQLYPTKQENRATVDRSIDSLTANRQEEMELSLESKILQLHGEGLEVEEIAEKLTCGKTEVELILNLQQRLKQNI